MHITNYHGYFYDFHFNFKSSNERDLKLIALIYISISIFLSLPVCLAGIEYQSTDLISVRIRALNPGKVTITATVQLSDGVKLPSSSVELIGK